MEKPLVSICCITYNQASYIAQCIEGFLSQKVDFPIEILIFDDASTDGNQDIVKKYAAQDSRIITYLQSENQWSKGKYGLIDWLFPAAKGKYIAFCEGDDFWVDPHKLQLQVDILEANPDVGLVHTDYNRYYQQSTELSYGYNKRLKVPEGKVYNNLHKSNFIATLTTVGRTDAIAQAHKSLKLELQKWGLGDYPMWLYIASQYEIAYVSKVTATYRILAESASNSNRIAKKIPFFFDVLKVQLYFHRNVKSVGCRILWAYISFIYAVMRFVLLKNSNH